MAEAEGAGEAGGRGRGGGGYICRGQDGGCKCGVYYGTDYHLQWQVYNTPLRSGLFNLCELYIGL